MEPVIKDEDDADHTDTDPQTDSERTDGEDSVATPSQSRSSSAQPVEDDNLFDGYSFKGRHSVIIDDEEEEADESDEEDDDETEETSVAVTDLVDILPQSTAEETAPQPEAVNHISTVDEVPEPTTPEARSPRPSEDTEVTTPEVRTQIEPKPKDLPQIPQLPPLEVDGITVVQPMHADTSATTAGTPVSPVATSPAPPQETVIVKQPIPRSAKGRNRREKSGIPALDRAYENVAGEDSATERDEDDVPRDR